MVLDPRLGLTRPRPEDRPELPAIRNVTAESQKTLNPNRMSRRALSVLFLLIFLGFCLRVATLSDESVDGDELFSRRVALLPMQQSLDAIRNDLVHPPLYYVLLKSGTEIWGASALGIRLWSLLFGVATLALVAAIGTTLSGGPYAGLVAAAILAVNQDLIFYSQQARSYSFYTFLVMLLALWTSAVTNRKKGQQTWLWAAGCVLMILLVYTHYVAALYVFSAVVAIVLCNVPRRTKALAVLTSTVAALSFVPWLLTIAKVYQVKHGVSGNLDWQGHPSFYNLKVLLASSIGIMDFKGATTLVCVLVVVLSISGLRLRPKGESLRDLPIIVALVVFATLPPFAVLLLSVKPVYLPLFGLRHLLPSIVALAVLCSYGLERLALRSARFSGRVLAAGSSMLLILALEPTLISMSQGPSRYPYNTIARDVRIQHDAGRNVYATWFYGIGEPVNYYCGPKCVEPLPKDDSALPATIVLLYRPQASQELQRYKDLLENGFVTGPSTYYTNGRQTPFGTSMVLLMRDHRD